MAGVWLQVAEGTGEVQALLCSPSACAAYDGSAGQCQSKASTSAQAQGGLRLLNCCGSHRLSVVQADGSGNVLCAQCETGYEEMQGVCIPCASVQWGSVTIGLLLVLALLFALHVLPGYGGAASLSIAVYFVQMSALFLSSESLAFVMGLANLSFVGDGDGSGGAQVGMCVIPLSDADKVWARLLMPLLCVAALGLLLAVNVAVRWLVVRRVGGGSKYTWAVYRWMQPRAKGVAADTDSRAVQAAPMQQPPSLAINSMLDDAKSAERWTEPLLTSAEAAPGAMVLLNSAYAVVNCEGQGQQVEPLPALLDAYGRTLVRLLLFAYNGLAAVSLALLHLRRATGPSCTSTPPWSSSDDSC